MRFWAAHRAAPASSLPSSAAIVARLDARSSARYLTALLRSARLALVRLRLFWLLMFATTRSLLLAATGGRPGRVAAGVDRPNACPQEQPRALGSVDLRHGPRPASATSRSSPTSTTASPRCPTASSSSTGAVDARDMREQYLDSMDLERERGITIKAQNVRVPWNGPHPPPHRHARPRRLRLRGQPVAGRLRGRGPGRRRRPGHRGPDAGQLLPGPRERPRDRRRLNKIDLPAADPDRYADEIEQVLGIPADDDPAHQRQDRRGRRRAARRRRSSASRRRPATPTRRSRPSSSTRTTTSTAASSASVRVMNGALPPASGLRFMQAGAVHDADEIGVRIPVPTPVAELGPGEVGYLIAGIKDVGEARSGETVTDAAAAGRRARSPATATPSRWCSAASTRSTATTSPTCARASSELQLNDASFTYEPETSGALGFGFRCGFLGLLHMEIVRERLEREFDLSLIATAPSVEYRVHLTDGDDDRGRQPGRHARRPARSTSSRSRTSRSPSSRRRPTPARSWSSASSRRGEMKKIEYLSPERVELDLPDPAGRGGHRLLRPAQEPHPGLRQPRLRARRLRPLRPGEGRRAPQRRARRRLLA